ncbi:hypothetical protein ES703_15756 [subsurface metagenome]
MNPMTLTKWEWGLLIGFIVLNLVDLLLTEEAIRLGSQELNPIMKLGNLWPLKTLFVTWVIYFVMLFRKVKFLKWVNIGMVGIVIYNSVAVWSWTAH